MTMLEELPEKWIIRTSDKKDFKTCRTRWDFGSKIRQDYEPNKVSQYLRFGIAFHKGLETWHAPETWEWTKDERALVLGNLSVAAFHRAYPKPSDERGNVITDPTLVDEWVAESELGEKMLRNYFAQSAGKEHFTPVLVEAEFEVPIVVPDSLILFVEARGFEVQPLHYGDKVFNTLHYKGSPVFYQGRIDMLSQASDGQYIDDWKTTAKFDSLEWLEMEDQITSYCWAFAIVLGLEVRGFNYRQFFKGVPGDPELLKSGKLSKNKQQNVTKETYLSAIDRAGLDVADYRDFLDYLSVNERQYFRVETVTRTRDELELAGRRIVLEAMDMIDDNTSIYPNPSEWNCKRCDFKYPCKLLSEGGDYEFSLNAFFHKRGKSAD